MMVGLFFFFLFYGTVQLFPSLHRLPNPSPPSLPFEIEEKCARTLEFPFSATLGENTASSAPS